MPRYIKPHFKSLEHFCRYKKWWQQKAEMFGPERDDLLNRLKRHESPTDPISHKTHLNSNLRPHLNSHLNSNLNSLPEILQVPRTEHQLNISDR